uniref:AP complex subunit sigma n=1 Tax=Solanum tuberosum TaxID=4113 RepID=M0ZJ81_SOLTU
MIKGVILMNDKGKPRLAKFYDYHIVKFFLLLAVLSSRAENVSNFVKVDSLFGPDARLVYKTYATLHILFIFDSSENELAMLDLMQGLHRNDRSEFVVTAKHLCFCGDNGQVFQQFLQVHAILDEIILGGEVLETSSSEVVKAVEEIYKMERAANSIMAVPSITSWQGR